MVQLYADGALIYDPHLVGYELQGLTATVSVERAGVAEIVMPATHPAYDAFTSLRTVVTIYKRGKLIFRGRALYPDDDFYGTRTITCEGERCFLRDVVVQPYLYQAAPEVIFSDLIERYNARAEPFKRFELGVVTARDSNNYVRLESESAEQVSDVIDKLVERVGGYIAFTGPADRRVINWYGSLDKVCGQSIELGENLLDFSRSGVNTDLATVVYPYGAKDETTGKRVTIAPVNGGKIYIEDSEAVARHGTIEVPMFWDDVTDPKNLLTKARKELNTRKLIVTTLELTALDLADHGVDIEALEAGLNIPIRSDPHGVDAPFLLTSRDYNFLDDTQDGVVLGKELATLTRAHVASSHNAMAQLQRTEQSIKTDYEIRISDAINNLRR